MKERQVGRNIDDEDGTENDHRTQGIDDKKCRERSGAEGTRTKEVKKPGPGQGQGGREGPG